MKLGVLAYLPPPSFGCAEVFRANLTRFAPTYELVAFSDHPWPHVIPIKNPEVARNAARPDGKANKWALNNLLWMTAMRIASKQGFTHVIYLESDCRVGKPDWDSVMFDEYFNLGRPCISAGSLAVWNPCNAGPDAARRWQELVSTNARRNHPIPTYGWLPSDTPSPSCVFANGALSVLDVAWVAQLFDLDHTMAMAAASTAWDMELGVRIWKLFGAESYEVVGNLKCVFSSYGNVLTSEAERIEMLRRGEVVGVHQVKSNATL